MPLMMSEESTEGKILVDHLVSPVFKNVLMTHFFWSFVRTL